MHLKYGLAIHKNVPTIAALICVAAFSGLYASASVVTFIGQDNLTSSITRPYPLSDAAAASFASAAAGLGTVSTITFEGAPLGAFSSLTVAPGVTLTGADVNGHNQTILNHFDAAFPTLDGFNTTPGGSNFLEMIGGTATFTFANPTQFFGAYISGIQTAFFADVLTFSDGTSQSILIPGVGTTGSNGALDFVGFTDAGKSITSITITASNTFGADAIGIDDVMYQGPTPTTNSAVPEPDSIVLMVTGGLGLAAGIRRRLSV
jgi:hypothetical protein